MSKVRFKINDTHFPAISWKVLVMMKSAWFIAIKSVVNWHEKW
jgi:hypothetical protein